MLSFTVSSSYGPSPLRALALLVATALFATQSGVAVAGEMTRDLVLEVWLNGKARLVDVNLYERDGVFWVEREDLQAIGIQGESVSDRQGTRVALNRIAGVQAEIEEADQRLMITADAAHLAPATFDLRPSVARHEAEMPATGIVAEYDVAATETNVVSSQRQTSLNAALSLTTFSPFGTFSTTGFARAEPDGRQILRLDSAATFDDPPTLRRLTVGDTISGGLSWSRSVRFGGVQLARDFSLQPDLVTIPLPDFFGDTAVPGSVDVFVGASKVFSGDLAPGPFEIRDLPIVTGAGQATVVVRDLLGHETMRKIDLYASNQMLAEGLTSYSIEAGFLRRSYGIESFDYGDATAQATVRYGLRNSITLEAHAEASPKVAVAGGGGIVSLQPFGTIQMSLARSQSDGGTGALGAVAVQSQFGDLNLYASFQAATPRFLDIAAVGGELPARQTLQLGAGYNAGDYGSFGASFLRVDRAGGERVGLAAASYTLSLGNGFTFGLTGVYDTQAGSLSAETFLSMPLGGGPIVSASVSREANSVEARASLDQAADPDGGFGYHFQASDGATRNLNAEVDWQGQHASVNARLASVDGQVSAQVEASGAVIAVDDSVFLTRRTDGAFALVSTGQEGVGIYRENREVARADADGEALLTGLVPFAHNRIAIEPRDYDMAHVLERTDLDIVPGRGGVAVDFTPKRQRSLLLIVTLPDGSFPPAGTKVRVGASGEPWVVGHRGAIFIADAQFPFEAAIEMRSGFCRVKLANAPPQSDGTRPAGPFDCVMDSQ